jgi:hypothetical protein
VAAAQPVERPDGKMAVRIPPTPNEAAGKTLSEIEGLQLSQFPIIKSVIQDNVRYEEQFYERNISARTNQDGSIVLTEEFTNNGASTGRSEIRYQNKKGMPTEYATLYDKYE